MEMLNRMATPQYARLDRAYQAVNRPDDFTNQLATIRVIYSTNLDANGNVKTNIGAKLKDDVFTMLVEFPRGRSLQSLRITLSGSNAERAVEDGLKKGDQIRFDGKVSAKLDDYGHLIRMPQCYAGWYEKVETKQQESNSSPLHALSSLDGGRSPEAA